MPEKQKEISSEKEKSQKQGTLIESEKENAQARAQLDASLYSPKKKERLESMRIKTDDVETQVSQQKKIIIHDAEAGNSIDV